MAAATPRAANGTIHVYVAVNPALTATNAPIQSVRTHRTSVGVIGFIASPPRRRRSAAPALDRPSPKGAGSRPAAADAHAGRTCRRARFVRGTSAHRGCSRVPTSSKSSLEDWLRWFGSGQVSWLSDRPTPRAFPASRPVTFAGFVPDYSDRVAAASHRLPSAPHALPDRDAQP